MSARASTIVLWVLVTPFVLERLGPVRFGIWSIFFAMIGYAAITDLGFGSTIPRFLPALLQQGDRAGARRLIVRALAVSTAAATLWVIAAWALRDPFLVAFRVPLEHHADARASFPLLGLSIAVFSVASTFQAVLLAEQRLAAASGIVTAALFVHVGVLVLALNSGYGLRGAAMAALTANLVNLVLGAAMVRDRLVRVPSDAGAGPSWSDVLRFGGMVQGTNLAIVSWNQLAKLILGMVGSLVQVATFEIALRLSTAASSLATLIQTALLPAVSHAWSRGDLGEVRTHYLWASRWSMALGSLLLGGVLGLAPAALVAWLGPAGADAIAPTRWLAAASLIGLLLGPAAISARACGWAGLEAAGFAVAVGAQAAVTWATGAAHGANAAAWGAVAGAALGAGLVVGRFHARIGQSTARWLASVVVPRAGAALAGALLAALWLARWAPDGRVAALQALAAVGVSYVAIYLLLTLPTGDLAALARRAGAWGAVAAGRVAR